MAKKTQKITLDELGDMLNHVVKTVGAIEQRMATKDDITELRSVLKADIRAVDTKVDKLEYSLRRELDDIKKQLTNIAGFSKEIDHALERIAAIERHLGINQKIAA